MDHIYWRINITTYEMPAKRVVACFYGSGRLITAKQRKRFDYTRKLNKNLKTNFELLIFIIIMIIASTIPTMFKIDWKNIGNRDFNE